MAVDSDTAPFQMNSYDMPSNEELKCNKLQWRVWTLKVFIKLTASKKMLTLDQSPLLITRHAPDYLNLSIKPD